MGIWDNSVHHGAPLGGIQNDVLACSSPSTSSGTWKISKLALVSLRSARRIRSHRIWLVRRDTCVEGPSHTNSVVGAARLAASANLIFVLDAKNTPVGGLFSPGPTFWFPHSESSPSRRYRGSPAIVNTRGFIIGVLSNRWHATASATVGSGKQSRVAAFVRLYSGSYPCAGYASNGWQNTVPKRYQRASHLIYAGLE